MMIKPRPKEKQSIYYHSFYQSRKRTSPLKWLIVVVFILGGIFWTAKSMAKNIADVQQLNFLNLQHISSRSAAR